ncbi:C-terminal binding protein [Anoxynatronum sibiricum]|uniref:C-terminal binding protein n=1 Tax=Anoxynatronum sibiricum TaxID=210623 RepID=A0ABU9VRL3_9CLOT
MKKQIVITDCDHGSIDIETQVLNQASLDFDFHQCKTEEDLTSHCKGARAAINQYAPYTRKVFESLPELELVVRYGVGVNNVDLDAATDHHVQVCNVPDYGMYEVADHALAFMLAMTRRIVIMNESVHRKEWDYQKSIPIFRHSHQTVGIIGFGRIGSVFAQRIHALGCRVIAYDTKYPSRENRPARVPDYVELVELETLLEQSDVVSIHCPLDNAHHLIGEAELQKMKESAFIINVSRGGIIDEEALNKALMNKWIAGAALDVTQDEPINPESPLFQHDMFLCTPHMAWYSEQAAKELKQKVAEEVVRFVKGEAVHYPVNSLKK